MYPTHTSGTAVPQADAAKIQTSAPPQAIELQVRKLQQRFALAPETARTVASIAFMVESQA
jgi:hypothetical protein